MSEKKFAIDNATVTRFAAFLILLGGFAAFFSLGQLEDPEFTIKTALVSTNYPGASPEEVEKEVTETIELELQKLKELDSLESYSRAGHSRIKVNIQASYGTDQLPQIWDKVRSRAEEAYRKMPPGASQPMVIDDFGDVLILQLNQKRYLSAWLHSLGIGFLVLTIRLLQCSRIADHANTWFLCICDGG